LSGPKLTSRFQRVKKALRDASKRVGNSAWAHGRRTDPGGASSKPVALITAFTDLALAVILREIAAGPQPPRAQWFVGTYGINKTIAGLVADTPGCGYAPVFSIQPGTSKAARKRRNATGDDAEHLDTTHAGEIPGSAAGKVLPPRDRRAWGLELGRRFRDDLRRARAQSIQIDRWQFDEILGQCADRAPDHREFVGGALLGIADGRPELGETRERGFVWTAHTAMTRLPGLAVSGHPGLGGFWEDVDRATLFLVGEEYPVFEGHPVNKVPDVPNPHAALVRSRGAIRRGLGERYIVGMSPGWRPRSAGLGGNLTRQSPAFVTNWRKGFIEARIAAQRPRGYAQFFFVKENAEADHAADAIRSLHHAVKRHGS
jgi:hypothetical protein